MGLKLKNKLYFLIGGILSLSCLTTKAQLTINTGATFDIQSGAVVVVESNLVSNANIIGSGLLRMKGIAIQNINMNGFAIPRLEIDNVSNTNITGNLKISIAVAFTNGKFVMGNNNVTLAPTATATGMAAGKFFETNGTGLVDREIIADLSNSIIPIGLGNDYMPVVITNTGSTYNAASIAVKAKAAASLNKHFRTESYLLTTWPIIKTGITGGITNAVATYTDPSKVFGTEADLKGFYWDGTNWSVSGGSQNTIANTAGADITTSAGELYAMNKFVLLNTKIFLQGPFNNLTGLMDDQLRNTGAYIAGNAPIANLLPSSDPYRTATYSANFIHVANSVTESVTNANVFNDQINPDKNIVDWIFLELRSNVTPGNTVIQTRAALLQRDGDIVDVDGISPIYFKNINPASYAIAVRHRNHLGISTNPSSFNQSLDLVANAVKLNFSNPAFSGNIRGLAGTNFFNDGSVNMMYAGDVNNNKTIKYSGAGNDRAILLTDLSSIETGNVIGYLKSDVNLNRSVKYSGAGNDRAVILSGVLSNNETVFKSQALVP